MATSQYSILRQYTPYTSPYNIDLIKDVMTYKQGQVDANRARMNQQMDYLMGQEIDKPEAREYLQDRMMNVINRVNDMYRGADLSSDGIVRHIQGEISSVLDSTVVNAIAGTKEGRRMQSYLSDLSLNHPEQYSAANAYVAMKPYYDWMNDGKAGSRLNPLNYTPYVDYNKELNDIMSQMQKTAGSGKKVVVPATDKDGNRTGDMIEYNIDAMTPQQVAAIAKSSMSPKARAQMSIDAAYMADMNPDMFSYNAYRTYMDGQTSSQQQYVDSLEAELMGVGANDIKRQQLNSEIKRAKDRLVSLKTESEINPNSYNPYIGANALVQNNFINGAAQRWSYDKSSYEMKEDAAFWKREAAERQNRQWAEEMKIKWHNAKIAEENAKSNRIKALAQERKSKEESKNGKGKKGENGDDEIKSVYVDIPTPTGGTKNISTDLDKSEARLRTQGSAALSRFIANIPEENKSQIDAFINEKRKDPNSGYANISYDKALAKYVIENGGLMNELFSNDKTGKKCGENFIEYLNSSAKLKGFDKRNEEKGKISEARVRDSWDGVKRGLFSGRGTILSNEAQNNSVAYHFIAESLSRNGRESGMVAGGNLTADAIGRMNNEINFIANERRKRTGEAPEKIDIWNYVSLNPNTGGWIIDSDKLKEAPEEMKLLGLVISDKSSDSNFYNDDNDFSATIDAFSDFYDDYSDRMIDTDIKYSNILSYRGRTYSARMTPKDAEFNTMNALRSIFNARADKKPEGITDYMIMHGGINESGGRDIYVKALYTEPKGDKVKEYAVQITSEELKRAGINVEDSFKEIPMGGYDSGMIPVTFGDSNDVNYNQLLISRSKSPVGSIYKSTLEDIENTIESKFSKDSDNIDVRKRRNALMSATNDIMKNYSKLAIEIKGFDKETSYMNGYNTILYKINESNPNGKPEKVIQVPNFGLEYADDLNTDVNISPQSHFYTILKSALIDEAQYMDRYGKTELNENGYLYKILKAVRGNGE